MAPSAGEVIATPVGAGELSTVKVTEDDSVTPAASVTSVVRVCWAEETEAESHSTHVRRVRDPCRPAVPSILNSDAWRRRGRRRPRPTSQRGVPLTVLPGSGLAASTEVDFADVLARVRPA